MLRPGTNFITFLSTFYLCLQRHAKDRGSRESVQGHLRGRLRSQCPEIWIPTQVEGSQAILLCPHGFQEGQHLQEESPRSLLEAVFLQKALGKRQNSATTNSSYCAKY